MRCVCQGRGDTRTIIQQPLHFHSDMHDHLKLLAHAQQHHAGATGSLPSTNNLSLFTRTHLVVQQQQHRVVGRDAVVLGLLRRLARDPCLLSERSLSEHAHQQSDRESLERHGVALIGLGI